MQASDLKIRASAIGKIMTFDNATQVTEKQLELITEFETKKVTPAALSAKQLEKIAELEGKKATEKGITDNQQKELSELITKRDAPQGLTENQQKQLDELIAKRDAPPELSKGAKTAVEEIFIEDRFSFRKQIESKYIQKGHKMEDKAILLLSDLFGVKNIEKNETHYANEYTQGTMDAIVRLGFGAGFQFDVKNVYYPDGIDGFDTAVDKIYEWQGHDYNWMLGFDHGFVVKILQNLPDEMLDFEVKTFWKAAGRAWYEDIPESFVKEVRDYFNFESRMPIEDRIKIFKISTTKTHIEQMTDAVKLARKHYATLEQKWRERNDDNINFIKSLVNGTD